MVVQGSIVKNLLGGRDLEVTKEVIRSIRRNLPGAEIVLPTWKGEDIVNAYCFRWIIEVFFEDLKGNEAWGALT